MANAPTPGRTYRVTWGIDIEDAASPEDAARKALEAITRPGSIAHVFKVIETRRYSRGTGEVRITHEIDLDEIDGREDC